MIGYQLTTHKEPINQEGTLQTIYRCTSYLNMRITPSQFLYPLHITIGNIHTTDKAHLTINDTYLTMITIVHLTGKDWEAYRHKGIYFYSFSTHTVKETILCFPRTYIIIDDTYLNSLSCFINQSISNNLSQGVTGNNKSI